MNTKKRLPRKLKKKISKTMNLWLDCSLSPELQSLLGEIKKFRDELDNISGVSFNRIK